LKEQGSENVYKKYLNLILPNVQRAAMPALINQEQDGNNVLVPDPRSQRVYYHFFSDTIVYYSNDDSFDSFMKIVFTAVELLKSGFTGLKMPYRGAIGYGDIISDNRGILIGTSIIDAYKGEQGQMWAGCMLTEDCEKFCIEKNYIHDFQKLFDSVISSEQEEWKKNDYRKGRRALVKYKVPRQKKHVGKKIEYYEKEHFVLDWTQRVYEGAAEKSFDQTKIRHQEMIRKNTIDFEIWARKNNH
jgi:hypothetical protein